MTDYNRVSEEWERTRPREERYATLIPGKVSENPIFLLEKLSRMESIRAKYKTDLNPEERLMLRILDHERKKLAKKLYPNRFLRMIRGLIVGIVKRRDASKQLVKNDGQLDELKQNLKNKGFGQVVKGLDQQLKKGLQKFNIPAAHYVSAEKNMTYDLSFSRDLFGKVNLDKLEAVLTDRQSGATKKHNLSLENEGLLSTTQLYNLMEGRPIRSNGDNNWMQFDLNDRQNGSYQVKEFSNDFDGRLRQCIEQLPVSILEKDRIMNGLIDGNQVEFKIGAGDKEKSFLLAGNTQGNPIVFTNEKGHRITIQEVLNGPEKSVVPQKEELQTIKTNEDIDLSKTTGQKQNVKENIERTKGNRNRQNRGHGKRFRAA